MGNDFVDMIALLFLFILICLTILLPLHLIGKYIVKKAVKECVTSVDKYINNLGFEPTAIYATVLCIPHQKDVSMFSEYAINIFSRAKTLEDKYKNLFLNNSLTQKVLPMFRPSRKTRSIMAKFSELPNENSFYYPQLGVFLNAEKKLFSVRSKANEINPKVYEFSKLHNFELSEDVRETMRGAVIVPFLPLVIGFGGKPLSKLSMRVFFSGPSGPEPPITLEPENNLLGEKGIRERISTRDPLYQIRCEELSLIAESLQWIHNNA